MYAAPDPSRESAALREVEKQAGAVADECAVARAGGNGLRCVAARPDGKELVVGDGKFMFMFVWAMSLTSCFFYRLR